MIKITEPITLRRLREHDLTIEGLSNFLMNNYSMKDIVSSLAEFYLTEGLRHPITITQEQFNAHFKIQGKRLISGEYVDETRGRKKLSDM